MWRCRATSGLNSSRRAEARWQSPSGKIFKAHIVEGRFGPLEVYLRRLGRDLPPQDGFAVRIPSRFRNQPGRLSDGRIRYLEFFDVVGRRSLMEFLDPVPQDLYDALTRDLFKEKKNAWKLRPPTLPQRRQADGPGGQPAAHSSRQQEQGAAEAGEGSDGHRLQRPLDGQDGAEAWLQLLGVSA